MLFNNVKSLFNGGKLNKEYADMTFDWEKAAGLIRKNKPYVAFAMLENSWDKTKCKIYQSGFPVYENSTLHLNILKPMLVIDSHDPIPCFKMEYETNGMEVWPQSALNILEGKE